MAVYTETIAASGSNVTITLTAGDGFKKLSLRNRAASGANATLKGNAANLGGRTSSAIVLAAGDSVTVQDDIYCLEGIVVTVLDGATVDLTLSAN